MKVSESSLCNRGELGLDGRTVSMTLIKSEALGGRKNWLVTGAAGFIGSHLVDELLSLGQHVTGLDNLCGGSLGNLEEALNGAHSESFQLIEADITDLECCRQACRGQDYVLHQAGLGSVPRSMVTPWATHAANVTGTLNVMTAAREAGIRRMVFASSSSVYGDNEALPKVEECIGAPLSPYAASKQMCEVYAGVFARCYGMELVGLRYFNVYGPRQSPQGPYAAVIPLWFAATLEGRGCQINGDGSTSRDFCYVANVVQANILAAVSPRMKGGFEELNVACGATTSLVDLHGMIQESCVALEPGLRLVPAEFLPFRAGDIKHSLADISKLARLTGYVPTHSVGEGLRETAGYYAAVHGGQR